MRRRCGWSRSAPRYHAAWARARWRAEKRRVLDVESLTDGGSELVEAR